jgi:hypothetical protein
MLNTVNITQINAVKTLNHARVDFLVIFVPITTEHHIMLKILLDQTGNLMISISHILRVTMAVSMDCIAGKRVLPH